MTDDEFLDKLWETSHRIAIKIASLPREHRKEAYEATVEGMRDTAQSLGMQTDNIAKFVSLQLQLIREVVAKMIFGEVPLGGMLKVATALRSSSFLHCRFSYPLSERSHLIVSSRAHQTATKGISHCSQTDTVQPFINPSQGQTDTGVTPGGERCTPNLQKLHGG